MTSVDPELLALRRELHQIPELGFEEHQTSARIGEELRALSNPKSIAQTGWVAEMGDEGAGTTLLLRADMDGLPVQEETDLPFASTHPGKMHACGHDAHMASLISAARTFRDEPPKGLALRLLFQPAEEGLGGAVACIEAGALDGVDLAFGLHVWNELPTGVVVATPGGMMAGVIALELVVRGRGGHGALPERTDDPIVAAAQLVMALQTVVSRRMDPQEPAVLTIGAIHGGDAFNVIPEETRVQGTIRYFEPSQARFLEEEVRRICEGIGVATGTRIEVKWMPYTIPTVNDPRVASLVAEAAESLDGVHEVLTDYRVMAGEDFGEILRVVPGCYALVGSGGADPSMAEPHHSPRFQIDESVLSITSALHREVVNRVADGGGFGP